LATSFEENYRFRKPFFMVAWKEGGEKAAENDDVTFSQRYERNEKSVSPGKWVSRVTR
jgi:hypothetical protein